MHCIQTYIVNWQLLIVALENNTTAENQGFTVIYADEGVFSAIMKKRQKDLRQGPNKVG